MVEIACASCGKTFSVSPCREQQARFCSSACYGKAQSRERRGELAAHWQGGKTTLVCKECGREFRCGKTQADKRLLCSRECADKWRTKHWKGENSNLWTQPAVVCKNCGVAFTARVSLVRSGRKKFCSRACAFEWRAKQRYGDAYKEHLTKTLVCEVCGGEYRRMGHQLATARYCSRSCLAKSKTGPRAPNWRGGISFEPYPETFNKAFKSLIRERDNHTCAICRLHGSDVHHIDYDKASTVSENCITLCRRCHARMNGHRDYWKDRLEELAQARQSFQIQAAQLNDIRAMQLRLWPV